ncbi:hypothetical protein QYF36_004459 [Acer negundo]|nr:hypothetical protein QYF36_004459 [Acer negundo]
MEGGSNSTSCMMAFGDNSNGLCPMMMMMPLITSSSSSHQHHHQQQQHHHHHHQHLDEDSNNTLFLPQPINQQNQHRNTTTTGSSSMILDDNTINITNTNINNTNKAGYYFMETNNNNNDNGLSSSSSPLKAKIMSHPHYHRLLTAYVNCQKVGAPPEVVVRLEEACASAATIIGPAGRGSIGEDPALDQFMEAYCEMLTKYEHELSKPFREAMIFLQRVESQFKALTVSSTNSASALGEAIDRNGSSEEDVDMNTDFIDPQAEDQELKGIAEAGTCRLNRTGFEANKQLVYKSKETALEAIGRYAICSDGFSSSSLLHGQRFGQPFPDGFISGTALS